MMRRRNKSEKMDILAQVPLFAGLSKKELGEIARHVDQVSIDEGTPLVHEGLVGEALHIIVTGNARVIKGKRKIAELGAGDVVGEMALIDGEPHSATVVATTPIEGLVVFRTEFDALLDRVPGLSRKLMVTLSRRLRRADKGLAAVN